jgi:hypothetical protein
MQTMRGLITMQLQGLASFQPLTQVAFVPPSMVPTPVHVL